jgi:CheY-like chemotaxis protein
MLPKKTILWVEDDPYYKTRLIPALEIAGFSVNEALDAQSAIQIITAAGGKIDLVVLDIALPHGGAFNDLRTKAGHETGLHLAIWLRDHYPEIPVVGFSLNPSFEVEQWFQEYGCGYFRKGVEEWTLVEHIKRKFGLGHLRSRGPRIFIVHGHDEEPIKELKKLLKDLFDSSEIVILRDLPGQGRTIIEKFEKTAESVDIVFVLLTPDDLGFPRGTPEKIKGRARQNVILELGYFYAKLQRTRGRVIVLCKGDVEKPSDIVGIEYIDISKGVPAATEKIKQELSNWLR